jgi:hypothetical protein
MSRGAAEPNEPNGPVATRYPEIRDDYGTAADASRIGRRATLRPETTFLGRRRVIGLARAGSFTAIPQCRGRGVGSSEAIAEPFYKTNPIRTVGRRSEPKPTTGPAESLLNKAPNEPSRAIAFYKTNPVRIAGRRNEPKPTAGAADPLLNKAPNEPSTAIAFYKTNPIRTAGRGGELKPTTGATGQLLNKAPNEPSRAIAFYKTNPVRIAGPEGEPKPMTGPAESLLNEPPNEPHRPALIRANEQRTHSGTAGLQGGVDSRASFGPDRSYLFGARVNPVLETRR